MSSCTAQRSMSARNYAEDNGPTYLAQAGSERRLKRRRSGGLGLRQGRSDALRGGRGRSRDVRLRLGQGHVLGHRRGDGVLHRLRLQAGLVSANPAKALERRLTLSMTWVLTHTEVNVVGCTMVLVWVTVMKSVMTSVTVAVWRTVI